MMMINRKAYPTISKFNKHTLIDIVESRFKNCPAMRIQYIDKRIEAKDIAEDIMNLIDDGLSLRKLSRQGAVQWAEYIERVILPRKFYVAQ